MKTSHQLATRFREVILNGTWIANTNFKAQLENTNWEMVTQKVGHLNIITVLAEHYGSYNRIIDGMIDDNYYHLGQIVLIKKVIN